MQNWRKYWRETRPRFSLTTDEALSQVGMTVLGHPVAHYYIDKIADVIATNLDLSPHDIVADLGCGNGLITAQIAAKVAQIVGIDISDGMIRTAQANYARANCSYHLGDIARLQPLPINGVKKCYSYGVLQHLTTQETSDLFGRLIDQIGHDLIYFVGGIPDNSRKKAFYNTHERWTYYERRLAEGTEQIGHWWDRRDLIALCDEFGLRCKLIDQPGLYWSHYRFDAKIFW